MCLILSSPEMHAIVKVTTCTVTVSLELQLWKMTSKKAQIYPFPQQSTKTGLLLTLEPANWNWSTL